MSESTVQSEMEIVKEAARAESPAPMPVIIWTPAFIVIFALALVVGLSVQSLLTQGWINHFYRGEWVLFYTSLVAFGGWLLVAFRARSGWIRIGAIFGCIWGFFLLINYLVKLFPFPLVSPIQPHLNALIAIALFGCYTCLSIDRTHLRSWDTWFFILTPLIGIIFISIVFVSTAAEYRSLNLIENLLALATFILSVCVWWIRPSCWKIQPGVTFLFGSYPLITLLLLLHHIRTDEPYAFFSQVSLLCIFLGILRVFQQERVSKPGVNPSVFRR